MAPEEVGKIHPIGVILSSIAWRASQQPDQNPNVCDAMGPETIMENHIMSAMLIRPGV